MPRKRHHHSSSDTPALLSRQEIIPEQEVPKPSLVESRPNAETVPVPVEEAPLPAEDVPETPLQEVEERRSSRIRKVPERLEVGWKGQSYEKQPVATGQLQD